MTYAARRPTGSQSVRSYADIGLETQVLGASPERLITLLYLGARAAIGQARIHLQEGRVAERGAAISKAIKIVDEGLKTGLNMEAGGDIAANLARLYDYIVRTLLTANLKADPEQLDIADRLLADLAEAWQTSIDRPAGVTQP
ncbi:flagellar export chaperone FliS [Achromobacter ruhlandii]|jgi:flagellar secretion chaperone FliS|uniref:Flagellar secretion chaperone FliS n=2 Tax=Burkholderiales TaxID=80840 RepID=A0A2M9GUB9_9BURK|nr:flagellar export chaperone FliS [Achromobacter ruhlandii]OCZ65973.1 flagellar export chaperone FliS [Achromobacter xylosoxidans]MCI1838325.1 flagellar export chaperone FliS [Achromobacter ruhlandii]MCV6797273.1 flagellar export chaperone FliS [Achromobacter ruhlandii]MCV6806544.1 flagellar export chaperone FliS [Achromobacter ruhlandii]MCV6810585.1 flagellar export chaperone FliS [Achromobacter ruhlandii]